MVNVPIKIVNVMNRVDKWDYGLDIPNFKDIKGFTIKAKKELPEVWEFISTYTKEKPIFSADIEAFFDLNGSEVRAIVNTCRRLGKSKTIIGGSKGYFMTDSVNVISEQIESLQSRIFGMTAAINGLKQTQQLIIHHKPQTDLGV